METIERIVHSGAGYSWLLVRTLIIFVIWCVPIAAQENDLDDSLTHSQMVELFDEFAADITTSYIYPDIAERIVEKIRADIENGVYDGVTTADSLASLLYKTTYEISHDRHFKVESLKDRQTSNAEDKPDRPVDFGANHGFREVQILPRNIGYVKLETLPGDDESIKAAAKEMAKVTSCDALIFDLLDNEGGSGDMVELLCNYLFDGDKLLYSFYDRDGNRSYDAITDPDFEGKRLSADAPVYVLVSEHTLSAAESFAYVLKGFNRAMIVGDTTIGMAHPARGYSAQNKIFYSIPFLRFEHSATGSDWEGTGVIPDILTDLESALDVAVAEARKNLDQREE
ncbi:MAG TPA: S41 family peptidase [Acidobacteriota bacterium]|nr:S41 family peptidase [Acidobacteriota bacterium]